MSEPKKIATLGVAPKTFFRAIRFNDVDGALMEVDITYHYMTATQHGQLIDQMAAAVDAENSPKTDAEAPAALAKVSAEETYRQRLEKDAAYLLKIAAGWGLEEPLTKDSAVAFLARYPAAMRAIGLGFYAAIHEGHAGN